MPSLWYKRQEGSYPRYHTKVVEGLLAERAAIDKLLEESKRTAPKVPELVGDQDFGGSDLRKWFLRPNGATQLGFHKTVDEEKAFNLYCHTFLCSGCRSVCAVGELFI